jgi:arylsulfate sulfotransferase
MGKPKMLLPAGILFLVVGACFNVALAMNLSLSPSIPTPAPVGTLVTWSATSNSVSAGMLWYRFRVRWSLDADFQVVKDFGPDSSLDWTASDHEGIYEIEVSASNRSTGESATASRFFEWTDRAAGGTPVISPTANAFVFLYSAPPCPIGSRMRVAFQDTDGNLTQTPLKPCLGDLSMNFYLAGLHADSNYWIQSSTDSLHNVTSGPVLRFTTPKVADPIPGNPLPIPTYDVLQPPQLPVRDGVLLQATLVKSTVATDLYGKVLWYYPGRITSLTRPQAGGTFFAFFEAFGSDPSASIVREFDLTGMTVRETNAARVNEQLAAMGKRQISAFHHEAREMPDGRVLVCASAEQFMTDIQGPGKVDVIGDVILVLDEDFQVVWAWDSFEHLDWYRKATLGEVCTQQAAGCPPFYQASQANDWTHGNSVSLTPDGNLLYSARHQDWLIKIDYRGGLGSGKIIWRLGKGGDFQITSTDPDPWFSHQHDAGFAPGDDTLLTLFDNGNVRHAANPSANSRGQALRLDEKNRVASFVLNADLGAFSQALGSAARLPNGNYHFDLGVLDNQTSQSVEINSFGNPIYVIKITSLNYRTFRMRDLYTPPENEPGAARKARTR